MWRVSHKTCQKLPVSTAVGRGRLSGQLRQQRKCSSNAKQPAAKPSPKVYDLPKKIPPNKKSFLGRFVTYTLVGGTAAALSGVAASFYDTDIRQKVESTVPGSTFALKYVYDRLPYDAQSVSSHTEAPGPDGYQVGEISAYFGEQLKNLKSSWQGGQGAPEAQKPAEPASLMRKPTSLPDPIPVVPPPVLEKPKEEVEKPKVVVEKTKEDQVKPTKEQEKARKKEEERLRKEEEKRAAEEKKRAAEEEKRAAKERVQRAIQDKEFEEAAENAALETILKVTVMEAEEAVKVAIDAAKSATATTRGHSQTLKVAMDSMDSKDDSYERNWEAVTMSNEARRQALEESEKATDNARMCLAKVKDVVDHGRDNAMTKKNPALSNRNQDLKDVKNITTDLDKVQNELRKSQSEAKVMNEYRDQVNKGKEQFKKELESIMPEVQLGKKSGKLSEEELNALIAHAHRRIEQLQRQLAEQRVLEQQRVERALERQQVEDEQLAEQRVQREGEKWQGDLVGLKQEWDTDARVVFEAEIRQQLGRQAAAHSDHIVEVQAAQKRELDAIHKLALGEKILAERDTFDKETAAYVARLKGIETAVEARADSEKEARASQELWLACQSFHAAITNGRAGAPVGEDQLRALDPEIATIREASRSHPMVSNILEAVPGEAQQRGVWTEEGLVQRFTKVKSQCRKVARVDETNPTPFRYVMSYVQSFFIVRGLILEQDDVNTEKLDTYVLVDSAAHALDNGNLELALRFVNQLQGVPRAVAADWIKEARLHLEAKQASRALLAHAAASGLAVLMF